MRKTYSLQSVFLSIVLVGMILLALLIGGVSVFEIDRFVKASTKELVTEKSAREAAQINETFTGMEKSVRIMESFILECIAEGEDVHSEETQKEIIAQANRMFAEVAKNTDSTVAYYFRFAPEIAENQACFSAKKKGKMPWLRLNPPIFPFIPRMIKNM